ncbi:MAG: TonB-dependent receptor, partial [Alphaproteobacteria bacterium]
MKKTLPARSPLAAAVTLALATAFSAPLLAAPEPKELDSVDVVGTRAAGYGEKTTSTATRTDTALRDVPQAITVVSQELIQDQAMHGVGDAFRYVPGVGLAQGEGNRDTPVLRGNSTTADFFVDGLRDDVQYFRDLYNIDRVEALKGPNAMIFGRGGSGGVINRVSKHADRQRHRELSLQVGSWDRARTEIDLGGAAGQIMAWRVTAMAEDSGNYRDGVDGQRHGINPTFAWHLGEATDVGVSIEHFVDDRVADRGVPSFAGRPLDVDPATFFGSQALSPVDADVDALGVSFEHHFGDDVLLRNRTRVASYDKFYQNVYPNAVSGDRSTVALQAYNNTTRRHNVLNQTDLVIKFGDGIRHTVLAGM